MAHKSLTVKENNSLDLKVTVKDSAGVVVNITGWSFTLTVRVEEDTADPATITKSTAGGASQVTITDAVNGVVEIYITPADTLGKAGQYRYDIQGVNAAGKKFTLVGPDDFVIERVVTRT